MNAIQIYWLISGICAVGVIVFVVGLMVLSWYYRGERPKCDTYFDKETGKWEVKCD